MDGNTGYLYSCVCVCLQSAVKRRDGLQLDKERAAEERAKRKKLHDDVRVLPHPPLLSPSSSPLLPPSSSPPSFILPPLSPSLILSLTPLLSLLPSSSPSSFTTPLPSLLLLQAANAGKLQKLPKLADDLQKVCTKVHSVPYNAHPHRQGWRLSGPWTTFLLLTSNFEWTWRNGRKQKTEMSQSSCPRLLTTT